MTMRSPLSSSPSSASSASELSSGSISKTGDESQSSLSVGVEGAVSSVRTSGVDLYQNYTVLHNTNMFISTFIQFLHR